MITTSWCIIIYLKLSRFFGLKGEARTLQGMCHHNNVKGLAARKINTLDRCDLPKSKNQGRKLFEWDSILEKIPDSFRHVCLIVDEGPFEFSTNKILCPAMGEDIGRPAISCNRNKFHASEIVQKDAKGMMKCGWHFRVTLNGNAFTVIP